MSQPAAPLELDRETLREEVRREYREVARHPGRGFHFHTGRKLAEILGYDLALVDSLPSRTVDSFAGTGNPHSLGRLEPGMHVVDVGCGAGIDSLLAAMAVGPGGRVVGVDMTQEMLESARSSSTELGCEQLELHLGYAESLPVHDDWAHVVLSNGVVNLCPDKAEVFRELYRVLRPGGRIQLADILVDKPVPEGAKKHIDLWTG